MQPSLILVVIGSPLDSGSEEPARRANALRPIQADRYPVSAAQVRVLVRPSGPRWADWSRLVTKELMRGRRPFASRTALLMTGHEVYDRGGQAFEPLKLPAVDASTMTRIGRCISAAAAVVWAITDATC
jgi:hypothetical protein